MAQIIKREFYLQDTLKVAKSLLGCNLCRRIGNNVLRGKIVETEAYKQNDPACHAYRGITKRCATLYKDAGIAYVYFIYGMYHCFNVVTESEGRGCAVLIRALEPYGSLNNTNGPSKLCRAMNITRELNEINLTDVDSEIWLEYGDKTENKNIVQTTRIGIKEGVKLPWRFYVRDNKWVSKK